MAGNPRTLSLNTLARNEIPVEMSASIFIVGPPTPPVRDRAPISSPAMLPKSCHSSLTAPKLMQTEPKQERHPAKDDLVAFGDCRY